MKNNLSDYKVAVLIPCYNEELTIRKVVLDFKKELPQGIVYVYDNNSTDKTAKVAVEAGAIVRKESNQGKGFVVRRMFSDIDADIYVMVDGDDTYDASKAKFLINQMINQKLDMVNGARQTEIKESYRFGHKFGNYFLTSLISYFFGNKFIDILSGYKLFSKRYIKSFPSFSKGFEIETELTVHALQLLMPVGEFVTDYKDRPANSESKLRTYYDGFRILKCISFLVKEEKPFQFFGIISLFLAFCSLGFFYPVLIEYLGTGKVPRLPTVVLSSVLMLLSFLNLFSGIILDMQARTRKEFKRLMYLR